MKLSTSSIRRYTTGLHVAAALVCCCFADAANPSLRLSETGSLRAEEDSKEEVDVLVDDQVDFSFHGGDWQQGNCGSRLQQSPVDFNEVFKRAEESFTYAYPDVHLQNIWIVNDGRSITADLAGQDAGGVLLPYGHPQGRSFKLRRIQFHAMSEHTLRGTHSPLEVQLVHEAENPRFATGEVTVSILIDGAGTQPNTAMLQADQHNEPVFARDELMPDAAVMPQAEHFGQDALLSLFASQELPPFRTKVRVSALHMTKGTLQSLLDGANFFGYRGSQTLPPCQEQVFWLVRQTPVTAAAAGLLSKLTHALYKISDGAGNYRTVMPLNQRIVSVWSATEKPPAKAEVAPDAMVDPSTPIAQDAIVLSKAAVDHARDLEMRWQRAAQARLRVLTAPDALPAMASGVTTTPDFDPRTLNETWAEQQIVQVMTKAAKDAIDEDVKEVGPAAASLARSYLRQNLLKQAGFKTPPA
mmetsp:Transcript_49600/g.91518  ORF Transcript_49600/g.91518 Transcript_49600/m.91518 type:complete len:470 (-) Transcript_49600:30-1439(-)